MSMNDKRVLAACEALEAYVEHTQGGHDHQYVLDHGVVDLLSDLRHWCEHQGIDFEAAVRTSAIHHEAEKEEATHGN
jgi:hypothetical protein